MFEIHSLRLGELMIPQGESLLRDPIHAWYVTDGKRRILVDSGMADAAEIKAKLRIDGSGGGHESLRRTLAQCGTAPEAIDTIIVTHLHFDHAWNLDLFAHAQVVVQREELMHAIDPAPTQRIYYPKEIIFGLLDRKRPSGLLLLNGDTELLAGITLLTAPGHTPGMHIPVITTARGKVALVSDLGDHYKCWFPADPRATRRPLRYLADSYLPGPIRSESERRYLESMRKIRAASDIVVPAHDFRIPVHMPDDWFEIPESTEGDLGHTLPAASQ